MNEEEKRWCGNVYIWVLFKPWKPEQENSHLLNNRVRFSTSYLLFRNLIAKRVGMTPESLDLGLKKNLKERKGRKRKRSKRGEEEIDRSAIKNAPMMGFAGSSASSFHSHFLTPETKPNIGNILTINIRISRQKTLWKHDLQKSGAKVEYQQPKHQGGATMLNF